MPDNVQDERDGRVTPVNAPSQANGQENGEDAAYFEHEGVRCEFSNTLADSIVAEMIRDALLIPARPHTNEKGEVDENQYVALTRTFSEIAAHSHQVRGVAGWRELDMFSTVDDIKAAAKHFLSGSVYPGTIVQWSGKLQYYKFGIDTLALSGIGLKAVQEGGAAAANFSASGTSESNAGSPISPPTSEIKNAPSPTPEDLILPEAEMMKVPDRPAGRSRRNEHRSSSTS